MCPVQKPLHYLSGNSSKTSTIITIQWNLVKLERSSSKGQCPRSPAAREGFATFRTRRSQRFQSKGGGSGPRGQGPAATISKLHGWAWLNSLSNGLGMIVAYIMPIRKGRKMRCALIILYTPRYIAVSCCIYIIYSKCALRCDSDVRPVRVFPPRYQVKSFEGLPLIAAISRANSCNVSADLRGQGDLNNRCWQLQWRCLAEYAGVLSKKDWLIPHRFSSQHMSLNVSKALVTPS